MKKNFLLFGLVLSLSSLYGMGDHARKPHKTPKKIFAVKTEDGVIDFGLKTFDGDTLVLSDTDSQVTLLLFWSPYCGHCKRELPDIIKVEKKYGDKLKVVSIGMWADSSAVKAVAEQYKVDFPVCVYDTVLLHIPDFKIRGVPTMFLLDENKVIKDVIVGRVPIEVLETRVKKVLGVKRENGGG